MPPLDQPLLFTPALRPRIWGGRRLGELLGKRLPDDQPYGESWELSGIGPYETRVAHGPFAGVTLREVWETRRAELLGNRASASSPGDFPFLIKWLDCADRVSVQVHPDDATARRLGHSSGKAEAWIVVDTAPGAAVWAGLQKGITQKGFERRIAAGSVVEALHPLQPQVGDVIDIPPGIVHAIGSGLLLLEVSQPSDATFRLDDWNRPGPDGRPRPLHIVEGLQSINWSHGPVSPTIPKPLSGLPAGLKGWMLVDSPCFHLARYESSQPLASPSNGELAVWIVIDGSVEFASDKGRSRTLLRFGETLLVPAVAATTIHPTGESPASLVCVTLPRSS